jgi:hypothetical protein
MILPRDPHPAALHTHCEPLASADLAVCMSSRYSPVPGRMQPPAPAPPISPAAWRPAADVHCWPQLLQSHAPWQACMRRVASEQSQMLACAEQSLHTGFFAPVTGCLSMNAAANSLETKRIGSRGCVTMRACMHLAVPAACLMPWRLQMWQAAAAAAAAAAAEAIHA